MERRGAGSGTDKDPLSANAPEVLSGGSFRTSNLDEFEEVVSTLVTPHRLAPAGRVKQAERAFDYHGVDGLGFFTIQYGQDVVVALQPDLIDSRIGFVMATAGHGELMMGGEVLPVSSREGVIFDSGPGRTLRYRDDCRTSALIVDRQAISAHCARLLGHDLDDDIAFGASFAMDGPAGQNWLRLARYANDELAQPGSLVQTIPSARRSFQDMVMTGLLFGHDNNFRDLLLRPQSGVAPYYVKRAEAFIEEHFAAPLSLADIAAHAGVSARSLQTGFRNFRNMTPMAFLRSIRLQRAHRALIEADPAMSTVTQIATQMGFSHMGEFANLYKRTFGATPRETISRAF